MKGKTVLSVFPQCTQLALSKQITGGWKGQVDGWMSSCMDRRMNEWMDGMDGWMDKWADAGMDGQTVGQMGRWMDLQSVGAGKSNENPNSAELSLWQGQLDMGRDYRLGSQLGSSCQHPCEHFCCLNERRMDKGMESRSIAKVKPTRLGD